MAIFYELIGAIAIQPGNSSRALVNSTTCTFTDRLERCSVLNYASCVRKNQNAFINLYKFLSGIIYMPYNRVLFKIRV